MASKFLQRLTLAAVLIGGLGLVDASTAAAARPVRRTARPAASGFNLFTAVNVMMNVNRIQCNINNIGETCVDPNNSSTVGGGYWPRGTPDQYIFNGGLQIAGIIPSTAGFGWAGDTVGVYFFDAIGNQAAGQGITQVYNGLDAADVANWPSPGFPRDTSLFAQVLVDRANQAVDPSPVISQQDTWVRYWEGNPATTTGRRHPMGMLVEQRGLMWNYPAGNQDIVYFLYRFINISSTIRADYDDLEDYGYSTADIDEIVGIARNFHAQNEAAFNVDLPDAGWTFTRLYAGFGQDPDVGNSGANFSTAVLPFAITAAYKSNFFEPTWSFPPDIFGAPFAAAPGFEGVKYLRSPVNPATGRQYGISMFTNTSNGPPFPDRNSVQALWRLASGNLLPVDGTCTVDPLLYGMCTLVQTAVDTRFYQYSGPFEMAPGEAAVIVVAYVHAAPVGAYITSAAAFELPPGIPGRSAELALGVDTLRTIERAAGWIHGVNPNVSSLDANLNNVIEQNEVPTVPRSLLNKALVAQAVFDNKFLLPFAPEVPRFFVLAGDEQVTVVWEPTVTETLGDPYFAVANDADPANTLYDPNFREVDVEGYRVWRGRTQASMEVVASFDYSNTAMTDWTGAFWNSNDYGNQCAPELGIQTTCPVDFLAGETFDVALAGNVIQVPPGGRVELASGDILIVVADTAVTGGNSGLPALLDNGVPFAFVDRNVRNGFRYYYSVTAFDVNSVASGLSSLESPLVTREVTPRVHGLNREPAGFVSGVFGRGATPLSMILPYPTVNAATGVLSGPFPPTRALTTAAEIFADQLVLAGEASITIDSIIPGWYHTARYFVTLTSYGTSTQYELYDALAPMGQADGAHDFGGTVLGARLRADSALALSRGLQAVPFAGLAQGRINIYPPVWSSHVSDFTAQVAGSFFSQPAAFSDAGGSRWFSGATETTADPTLGTAAGALTGVDAIFRPWPYLTTSTTLFRRFEQTMFHVGRSADIKIYWGATAGTVDSVIDVTHNLPVRFDPQYRASYGFMTDLSGNTAGGSTPNGVINPLDFLYGPCIYGQTSFSMAGCETRDLVQAAVLTNVDVTGDNASDGTGFGLYINGEPFIFQVTALPSSTVWTYRAYMGEVAQSATGVYSFVPRPSNPAIPGLAMKFTIASATTYPVTAGDLTRVHTVPDPYYVTNQLEITANTKNLRFVNLPERAIIRIYSVGGVLVTVLTHNDITGGGDENWNLRNRNNQFVASGVYFFHVETPDGRTQIGRFTVVNYAQ